MQDYDTVQRFIFEHAKIRGEIVRIEKTYQDIINNHNYPPMINYLLGEAILSSILLTSSIKFKGNLTVQFQGDHRITLLLAQCDHDLNVRAFVKCEEGLENKEYAEAFLHGNLVININQYDKTQTYQSIVPLQSTSMAENLMNYFAQSEQLSTKIWLAVNDSCAAGMILQLMPGEETSKEREEFWEYAIHLGETLSENELLEIDNSTLLHRLYHETELRLFEPRPTRFQCQCSQVKMKQALTILGEDDLKSLLKEQGKVEVSCDFCNKKYYYDEIDIALLFHQT